MKRTGIYGDGELRNATESKCTCGGDLKELGRATCQGGSPMIYECVKCGRNFNEFHMNATEVDPKDALAKLLFKKPFADLSDEERGNSDFTRCSECRGESYEVRERKGIFGSCARCHGSGLEPKENSADRKCPKCRGMQIEVIQHLEDADVWECTACGETWRTAIENAAPFKVGDRVSIELDDTFLGTIIEEIGDEYKVKWDHNPKNLEPGFHTAKVLRKASNSNVGDRGPFNQPNTLGCNGCDDIKAPLNKDGYCEVCANEHVNSDTIGERQHVSADEKEALGNAFYGSERKNADYGVCDKCGGKLKKISPSPGTPGAPREYLACDDCGLHHAMRRALIHSLSNPEGDPRDVIAQEMFGKNMADLTEEEKSAVLYKMERQHALKNADIKKQGKAIVEKDGDGFLIMFPDGTVKGAPTKERVQQIVNKYFEKDLGDEGMGVGLIEWRNADTPGGIAQTSLGSQYAAETTSELPKENKVPLSTIKKLLDHLDEYRESIKDLKEQVAEFGNALSDFRFEGGESVCRRCKHDMDDHRVDGKCRGVVRSPHGAVVECPCEVRREAKNEAPPIDFPDDREVLGNSLYGGKKS